MHDPLQQLYRARSYPAMSHPLSDPAVSSVAALLGGLHVKHPSGARILEIACSSGHNLIPLAMRWPDARFVGIDFSD
jgi:trans-aconitate methyltransferase